MIKPLADRVVIEPKEAETKTASGLYIPDTAKEKPQQGIVAAVKFIDAAHDLSIQVHPNDALAQARHGKLGKTEMLPLYHHIQDF